MTVPATSLRPPKVSVVMPAYNRAKEIGAAIDSVLAQTFEDIELIVVDDGSTDATPEIVRAYGDRVRFFQQKNAGVGAARNAGVRLARGEYLASLDSDDVQLPFRLATQVALLDRSPDAAMVFTDFKEWMHGETITEESTLRTRWLGVTPRKFDDDLLHHFRSAGKPAGDLVPAEYADRRVYEGMIHSWLCSTHITWGCVQMARTDAINRVGGHWEAVRAYEDYVVAGEMSKRWPLIYLDVPTCNYRVHPHQLVGRRRLNGECFRDALLHCWKADPRFYPLHRDTINAALATTYAMMGEVEAVDGNWAAAEDNFRRAIVEWSAVGRRPYANLLLTAIKHRLPLSRMGLLGKVLPGFVPMGTNKGRVVQEGD